MTQFTRLGYFGSAGGWNDSTFTVAGTPAAVGQWTRLGYFGAAGAWNGASFGTAPENRTVRITFDAPIAAVIEPFDEWRIRAMIPAWVTGDITPESVRLNIDIDRIRAAFASSYRIRGEWI